MLYHPKDMQQHSKERKDIFHFVYSAIFKVSLKHITLCYLCFNYQFVLFLYFNYQFVLFLCFNYCQFVLFLCFNYYQFVLFLHFNYQFVLFIF